MSDLPAVVSWALPGPQCAGPPGTVACCPRWKHSPGSAGTSCSGRTTSSGLHSLSGQLLVWWKKKGLGKTEKKTNVKFWSWIEQQLITLLPIYCVSAILLFFDLRTKNTTLYSETHQLSTSNLNLCLSAGTALSSLSIINQMQTDSTGVHLPKHLSALQWILCTSTCRECVLIGARLTQHTLPISSAEQFSWQMSQSDQALNSKLLPG